MVAAKNLKVKLNIYDSIIFFLVVSSFLFNDIRLLRLISQAIALFYSVSHYAYLPSNDKNQIAKIMIWASAFSLYSMMSALWASLQNGTAIAVSLSFVQASMLTFSLLVYGSNPDRLKKIINHYIFASFAMCLRLVLLVPISMWGNETRITKHVDFLGNGTEMSLAICAIIILIAYFEKSNYKKPAWLTILLMITLMVTAFATGTKKVILIIAVGIGAMIVAKAKNPINLLFKIFIVAFLFALGYWAILNIESIYQLVGYRVESLVNGLLGGDADGSTRARMALLEDAWHVFKENPIFGVGCDGYRYENSILPYFYSHVNYIELLANLGFVGFVMYYYIYATLMIKAIHVRSNTVLPITLIMIRLAVDTSAVSYDLETTGFLLAIIIITILTYSNKNKEFTYAQNIS